MFTTKHFIWIGICILFILIMNHYAKKEDFTLQNACYFFMFICLLSETTKMMSDMIPSTHGGMHLNPQSLPFHICSILLFIAAYITFGKDGPLKQKMINFFAVVGTCGGIAAILIPTYGVEFNVANVYQCFMYHATLTWFSLYLIRFKHANLGMQAFKDNLVVLFALLVFNLYMNSILAVYDTNFMFIVRPPLEGLPFLNLNHGYYIYLFRVIMLGVIGLSLFHLPFIVKERKRPPFYLGGLYYESMTESILNVGTHLIDDGYDEFIMITADPLHVESVQLIFYTLRNKRKNMQNPRCS